MLYYGIVKHYANLFDPKLTFCRTGIKSPDCIAYDWISDLIYWSDGTTDSIEVRYYFADHIHTRW